MNSHLTSWVRSAALGVIAAGLMLAVVIVVAEELPNFKNWLKATFYHHWLGKGALSLALFTVVTLFVRWKGDSPSLSTVILWEVVGVIVSCIIIAGFFLLHVLHWV